MPAFTGILPVVRLALQQAILVEIVPVPRPE
jgi:hypothetical protein